MEDKTSTFEVAKNALSGSCRAFPAVSDDIEVLDSPQAFYQTLLDLTRGAHKEITLSALYFGHGEKERALAQALTDRASEQAGLRINLMFDYRRALRGVDKGESAVNIFSPLLRSKQHSLHLLHVPAPPFDVLQPFLRGRARELLSVHHMKIYAFDDTVMLSGANLSDIYFEQRQDRYIVIRDNPALARYFHQLVATFGKSRYSHTVDMEGVVQPPPSTNDSDEVFSANLKDMVQPSPGPLTEEPDTWLFPTLQVPHLGIKHDEHVTQRVFELARSNGGSLDIASGYMNLTQKFIDSLLRVPGPVNVFGAGPEANGFWGASGLAANVPDIYSEMTRMVLEREAVERPQAHAPMRVMEYHRPGWTYHAKGIWWAAPPREGEGGTLLNTVGSPNYGERSDKRDTEAQLVMVTRDPALRARLTQELKAIGSFSTPVKLSHFEPQQSRHLSRGIQYAARFLRTYL